jgi:hypothetical protein
MPQTQRCTMVAREPGSKVTPVAGIYARVSGAEQAREFSLGTQISLCQELAEPG